MTWRSELERYEREHLSKKGEHYRKSSRSYLRRIGEHTGKSFKELTLEDFESFLASTEKLRKLKPSSIKAVHAYAKACARWMNGGETPKEFPALGDIATVTMEDTLRVKKPSELLTDEEFEGLCRGLSKRDEVIVRLIRATGCRPGEVLRAERNAVNWETHDGQEVCLLSVTDTKTGEPRQSILFHPEAAALLKDYLLQTKGRYLFPSPRDENEPMTPQALWLALQRVKKDAKIDEKKRVYAYLLRHMFASKEGAKMTQADRDAQMGWKTDMYRRYTHLATEQRIFTALKLGVGRPVRMEGDAGLDLVEYLFEALYDRLEAQSEALQSLLPEEDRGAFLDKELEWLDTVQRGAKKMGGAVRNLGGRTE